MCLAKRDLVFSDLVARNSELMLKETNFGFGALSKRRAKKDNDQQKNCGSTTRTTTTTSIGTYMTTPLVTCSARWTQACYHYSSVMREHYSRHCL